MSNVIKFESNYGNFAYRLEAAVPDGGSTTLMVQGLANIAYRVAGSSIDKALSAKDRKAVLYSEEDAQRINAAVSAKIVELEKKDATLNSLALSFSITGQHVFGESNGEKSRALATAMWTQIQSQPDASFKVACSIFGIDPESYTDASAVEAIHAFNQGAKKKKETTEAATAPPVASVPAA